MTGEMLEDISKEARLRKLAALREHLERMPPDTPFNTGKAAIYVGVSTKTLARWRQVKGMGPRFRKPVVAKGAARTTQPHQYIKQDLDIFNANRMSSGGFDFASLVEPWQINAAGAIEGSALTLSMEELLEADLLVATLLDALAEPWVSAAAMRPYRNELEAGMRKAMEQIDSNLLTLQLEENTALPTGKSRGSVL
ncbi:MAG: hypothetical protein ACTHOC_01910 [Luteimonas sp.]